MTSGLDSAADGRVAAPPYSESQPAARTHQAYHIEHVSEATETFPLLGSIKDAKEKSTGVYWKYRGILALVVAAVIAVTAVATKNKEPKYCVIDIEEMDRIRAGWETEAAEHEQERLRMQLFWDGLETKGCVRYKRRKYHARLMNVAPGYAHPLEACMKTPLPINGVDRFPVRCEDKGLSGLFGIFEENGEGYCATFFEQFQPMECTAWGSGLKRYRMAMVGLDARDDWRDMCSSTPARFLNKDFESPTYCDQENGKTYGYWEVPDDFCIPY